MIDVDVAVRAQATLGAGTTWDVTSSTLLWVDVLESLVHRYNPLTGWDETQTVPQEVGTAQPRAGGGLVLNLREGIALVDPAGARRWLVYWAREGHRGSHAGIDPAGRLWAGTVRDDDGSGGSWLARVEPDGAAKVVLDDVEVGDGVGWSPDGSLMYLSDSAAGRIDVFDFDAATGEVARRRQVCAVDRPLGGLCVDADGAVWVVLREPGAIRRYTATGSLDVEIPLPVTRPTACCFGGEAFTDLYVSTARAGLSSVELTEQELAGSVLVLPGVGQGQPTPIFAG